MWSKKHDKCIKCGTTEKKHKGNGLCVNCYRKENRYKYYERERTNSKKWYYTNCEKAKKTSNDWSKKNRNKIREAAKVRYHKNPEKQKEESKGYRKENPEKYKEAIYSWQKRHPEKIREYNRSKKHKEAKRKCHLDSYHNDPHYKLRCNISTAVGMKLKKHLLSKNGKSTFSFLPYTIDELKSHLEKQFEPWMNWQNWGIGERHWQIDHIRPDCSFNYTSTDDPEFQKCWALKNLRPLGAIDNNKKNGKIIS